MQYNIIQCNLVLYSASNCDESTTANLGTILLEFRGFDSSRTLISRGGILMSIGNFLEVSSQRISVGIILVGRSGADVGLPGCRRRGSGGFETGPRVRNWTPSSKLDPEFKTGPRVGSLTLSSKHGRSNSKRCRSFWFNVPLQVWNPNFEFKAASVEAKFRIQSSKCRSQASNSEVKFQTRGASLGSKLRSRPVPAEDALH